MIRSALRIRSRGSLSSGAVAVVGSCRLIVLASRTAGVFALDVEELDLLDRCARCCLKPSSRCVNSARLLYLHL